MSGSTHKPDLSIKTEKPHVTIKTENTPLLEESEKIDRNAENTHRRRSVFTYIPYYKINFMKSGCRFMVVGDYSWKCFEEIGGMIQYVRQKYMDYKEKKQPQPNIWIDIQCINEKNMKMLEHMFSLHPLTSEDCLNEDTGEKWELFPNYLFVVISRFCDTTTFEPEYINIIVMKNFVITIHRRPMDELETLIQRLEFEMEERKGSPFSPRKPGIEEFVIPSTDWVLHTLMDIIVDNSIPIVDFLQEEAEHLDEIMFSISPDEKEEFLKRISNAKKRVNLHRRMIDMKRIMCSHFITRPLGFISPNIQTSFRDVLDHLKNSIDKLNNAEQILLSMNSNFMLKLNMDISEASSRTDTYLNRLSLVASVLTPVSVVSGLLGMNVKVPFQEMDSVFPFWVITGSLAIFSCVLFIIVTIKMKE